MGTQAVRWYNEQFLYSNLRPNSKPRSFSDGEKQLLDQRGIDNRVVDAARTPVSGEGDIARSEPEGAGGGTTVSNQVAETQERK